MLSCGTRESIKQKAVKSCVVGKEQDVLIVVDVYQLLERVSKATLYFARPT